MWIKLALRNVRRQIGNYLIYFITVSLTVALTFAINNVIFSPQILKHAQSVGEIRAGLILISAFVCTVVAFVVSYASVFMLRLRRREFGTYLTFGMRRRDILTLFVLETFILGLFALAAGVLAGLFLYQGLMALLCRLMQTDFAFSAYSTEGLLLTLAAVGVEFLISALVCALFFRRVQISRLLHGSIPTPIQPRRPWIRLAGAAVSLFAILAACILFSKEIDLAFTNQTPSASRMFALLCLLAVSLFAFHVSFCRGGICLLLKARRFCGRGLNAFVLRQLSARLHANAIMSGILALLISFSIIGANVSFTQKADEQATLLRQYPYDVLANFYANQTPRFPLEDGRKIIEQFSAVSMEIPYQVFTSLSSDLHRCLGWWSTQGDIELYDCFLTERDYNALYVPLGYEPLKLDGGFIILTNTPRVHAANLSSAELILANKTYPYRGMLENMPMPVSAYFLAVIPDEAAQALHLECTGCAIQLENTDYDAAALHEALSYAIPVESGGYTYSILHCDYDLREYARQHSASQSAVFIVGAVYIALVFTAMAMAVLALKLLSGIAEDRERYKALSRIGASRQTLRAALLRQNFFFFFFPFALPMLLSIPTAIVCAQLMRIGAAPELSGLVYQNAAGIALSLILLYLLYFTATHLLCRRILLDADPCCPAC